MAPITRDFILQVVLLLCAVDASNGVFAKAIFFVPGTFDGPSIHRTCTANAIAVCLKKRWTLVVPELRFNYADLSNLSVEPFELMFDVSALTSLSSLGLTTVTSLPKSKRHACILQLQHSLHHAINPSMATMEDWAHRHGVVCLHDRGTLDNAWMRAVMSDSLKTLIRKSIRPSSQFQDEVDSISSDIKRQGSLQDFVALHARLDDGWIAYCQWEQLRNETCHVGEEELLSFLQEKVHLNPGSPLYIAGGLDKTHLLLVCEVYDCFHREYVWLPSSSLIPHAADLLIKSYMDFLIIQLADTFIGNRFSHFSMELFHHIKDAGKSAMFVNNLECPLGKRITYVGCQPTIMLDCCI